MESTALLPLVRCEGVGRTFGPPAAPTVALTDVDLMIEAGTRLALVGPSGCGKSTLLHLLGAMDRADRGTVAYRGDDLALLDDASASRLRREEFGFVFQFFNLLPTLTALDNVALPARLAGRSRPEAQARARELLERVGLASRSGEHPDALSGGQQQRIAIARALVNRPRLILADEPTGALDRQTGDEVLDLLNSLVSEAGSTLVTATHSDRVVECADRVVRLEDGRVQAGNGAA